MALQCAEVLALQAAAQWRLCGCAMLGVLQLQRSSTSLSVAFGRQGDTEQSQQLL
eukprot:CAMPEP_0178416246 /NCGR_PEP_ID=MMETSP0689_2-20121128/23965_1 /TAXON_ID=160604 /ORGANISM="Amphidinium massartii, Strain CS-259" /LENGTH=54 /DNA_ID=CAMNT_0020037585 /DNA_START=36 /DNA_END=200 /DNA_ORIENTATION=+